MPDITQTVNPANVAVLMDDIGSLLGNSDCDVVECIEALTCVLGDAVAQTTNRKFSKVALSATMLFVTEAYTYGCTPDDTTSTMQ
jgi:hypothetical protein